MTAKTKRIDLVDPPKPLVFEESKPFEDQVPVVVNISTDIDLQAEYVRIGAKVCASVTRNYTDGRTASLKSVLLTMQDLLTAEISKLS